MSSSNRRSYRIGDFAKYMGVTPDFLKHYEKNGLLNVEQRGGNYRWYGFDQASRILEYMRLRNYGVSVREMHGLITSDAFDAMRVLDAKAASIEAEAARMLAVATEHRRLSAWFEERRRKPFDWEVRRVEASRFLPHSDRRDFIKDERIHTLLNEWIRWMPVTKSALRLSSADCPEDAEQLAWGLMLPESVVEKYAVPMNDAVIKLPARKALVFSFLGQEEAFNMDALAAGRHPAFEKVRELGLTPTAGAMLVVEMKLSHPDGTRRSGAGRLVIPVED